MCLANICIFGFFFLCLQTAAEYERRRENFFNELEVVFADVVIIFLLPLFFSGGFFSIVFLSDHRNGLKTFFFFFL